MRSILLFILCALAWPLWAEERDALSSPESAPEASEEQGLGIVPASAETPDSEREPAAVLTASTKKRNFPGGADEEDLRVQAALPEAALRVDSRSLQREIYKQLYNQELKEEQQNDLEE